jgi:glycosyltransferase involved in cell wall biosynthesis
LEQRYPEFEVIVSDNAGKMSAEEALASIDDPRLKIFRNEKNLGMAGNMNKCLERCSYDVFKLNCDDDLLHPDSLACSIPFLDDETVVIHDMEKFAIGNIPEGINQPVGPCDEIVERKPGYRRDFWKQPYDSLPGDTLCTRTLFKELGGYDPKSDVDDWDFAIRARLRYRIVHVKAVLCYQGVWGFSLTEKMLKEEPYYFQQAGLRTHFKVMRDPTLTFLNQLHVMMVIFISFIQNGLRFLKYLSKPQYRSGYADYLRSMWVEIQNRNSSCRQGL